MSGREDHPLSVRQGASGLFRFVQRFSQTVSTATAVPAGGQVVAFAAAISVGLKKGQAFRMVRHVGSVNDAAASGKLLLKAQHLIANSDVAGVTLWGTSKFWGWDEPGVAGAQTGLLLLGFTDAILLLEDIWTEWTDYKEVDDITGGLGIDLVAGAQVANTDGAVAHSVTIKHTLLWELWSTI